MPIDITIIKSPENVSNERASQTFSEGRGTIGRGQDNAWVLEDPECFMSTRHSEIVFQDGQYFLTDLSTNGTFLNGSAEPIGNGNRVSINDGDRFAISDYEFLVSVRSVSGSGDMDAGPFANADFGENRGFVEDDASLFPQNDPFGMPLGNTGNNPQMLDSMFGMGMGETDPIAVLDKVGTNSQAAAPANIFNMGSHSDQASAINESIAWPESLPETGGIPTDWDKDFESATENVQAESNFSQDLLAKFENEYFALEEENKKMIKEITRLTQQLKTQAPQTKNDKPARSFTAQDKTLIEAMGLDKCNLSKRKMTEISQIVGVLVRETMEGMMQVLNFRKKIKEEFRINVTTIQPIENNPLKFSANVDDAMENMFIKENNAYQEPIDAVREGFQGIAEHQVAMLAGMQAAFRGMIERFDPEALEKRFEKYNKSGLIHFGQKGKKWESYKEFHQELVNNMDNSFQHLFGYDFVQAYEDQMQRLAMTRKAGINKKI